MGMETMRNRLILLDVSCSAWVNRIVLASVLFLLAFPAWGETIFSSGAINGTIGSDSFITPPWSLSQSFTVASDSYITDLSNVGIWLLQGTTLASLTWTISTDPDDAGGASTLVAQGLNVAPSSATQLTPATSYGNNDQFDVYNTSYAVDDVLLTAGTYYLSLSDGVTSCDVANDCADFGQNANSPFWDENGSSGGGLYFDGGANGLGGGFDGTPNSGGWSFELDGYSASASPEPGSIMLLGAGLVALGVRKAQSKSRLR